MAEAEAVCGDWDCDVEQVVFESEEVVVVDFELVVFEFKQVVAEFADRVLIERSLESDIVLSELLSLEESLTIPGDPLPEAITPLPDADSAAATPSSEGAGSAVEIKPQVFNTIFVMLCFVMYSQASRMYRTPKGPKKS